MLKSNRETSPVLLDFWITLGLKNIFWTTLSEQKTKLWTQTKLFKTKPQNIDPNNSNIGDNENGSGQSRRVWKCV